MDSQIKKQFHYDNPKERAAQGDILKDLFLGSYNGNDNEGNAILLSGYSMSFDENLYSIGFNYWIDLSNSNFFGIGGTFAIARSGAQTALVFDGSTTYGQVGYSGNNIIPIGNNDYTISVWFNPSNVGGVQGLVGWGDYGNTNEVNTLRLDGSEIMNSWSLNEVCANIKKRC